MLWMILRLLPFFFMADSGGGEGGGEGDSGSDNNADTGGKQGGGDQGGGDDGDKPFAQFPDADSFNARMDREARQRLAKQAEELGFDSVDAMLEAAKTKREADDAAKSEAEKAREEADRAKSESATAIAQANQRLINAEARVIATELGIKTERIPMALKLADLSEIEVGDDGEPNSKAIKAALESVLKELPELKSSDAASKSGAEFNGNGTGEAKDLRSAIAARLGSN